MTLQRPLPPMSEEFFILKEIDESKLFSILLDDTTDVSNVEKVSFAM
jgi:hypothetical protein